MKFILRRRDFSDNPMLLDLDFEIMRFSWDVIGGPKQATVNARGARDVIFNLVNLMRSPVEIISDKGEIVWWGYLDTLDINYGSIRYGVNMNGMFNKTAVAYTEKNVRYTTDWSEDADSVLEYGYKEIFLSRTDAIEVDAIQQRDTYLAATKYPIPTIGFESGEAEEAQATLICRGWYETLEWQYYTNLAGEESYTVMGQGGREVGEDDRPILAMSFQIAAAEAWTATTLWLSPWKVGTPSDNLVITIRATSGGLPGSVLATSTKAGSAIQQNSAWMEFPLSASVTLSPSTIYWIHAQRSSSVDPNNYFMLDTNLDNGYPRGSMYLYNTTLAAWVSNPGKGDLIFRLVGVQETTEQIANIIDICGQFFPGSIIENESGIESGQYRNGDSTGLYELEKLLLVGTSNARRLLAEVTHNRYLRIYEEPVKPVDTFGLDKNGRLSFKNNTPMDIELCPVGIWCHLVDVIPSTVDLSMVASPDLFFIEEAEYSPNIRRYQILRTRDQSSVFDIGGIEQG